MESYLHLVMVNEKPSDEVRKEVAGRLGGKLAEQSYEGEATKRIEENLELEAEGGVIVTADSRLLKFVPYTIELKDVYLFEDNRLVRLEETTDRILRPAHNLMNLFESGEFTLQTAIKRNE